MVGSMRVSIVIAVLLAIPSAAAQEAQQQRDVTFPSPLHFTGRAQETEEVTFPYALRFTGTEPNDLSQLEAYQAEIRAVNDIYARWYMTSELRAYLVERLGGVDALPSAEAHEWIGRRLGNVWWTFSEDLELKARNWRHYDALQAAIDDLRLEPDPSRVQAALDHFEAGMERWRDRIQEIDEAYTDCLINGLIAAWGDHQTYVGYRDSPAWNTDAADAAYAQSRASLHAATDCTSVDRLGPLTENAAFSWPSD